jgi:hypothetical protein
MKAGGKSPLWARTYYEEHILMTLVKQVVREEVERRRFDESVDEQRV